MCDVGYSKSIEISHLISHISHHYFDLPFDLAQGGESFDFAQDREPVERLVEPFRASRSEDTRKDDHICGRSRRFVNDAG
jgi:hypothetical protein